MSFGHPTLSTVDEEGQSCEAHLKQLAALYKKITDLENEKTHLQIELDIANSRLENAERRASRENQFGSIGQPCCTSRQSVTPVSDATLPSLTTSPTPTPLSADTWQAKPLPATMEDAATLFYKSLMTGLKEANRRHSNKSSSWRNPMLYKTTLCDHWQLKGACRFGSGCWYAHGQHDLRAVPSMSELPTPEFIHRYLSYLGLPKTKLDGILAIAYQAAGIGPDGQIFSDVLRSLSCTNSPMKPNLSFDAPLPADCLSIARNDRDIFQSSITSEADWDLLQVLISQATLKTASQSGFQKSFRLFGDSYPLKGQNQV